MGSNSALSSASAESQGRTRTAEAPPKEVLPALGTNTRLRLEKRKSLVTDNLRTPHSHLHSPALAGWRLHQSAHIVLQAVAAPSASCLRSSVSPSGTLPSSASWAVVLLFSFPPAPTFVCDALRRIINNFQNQFSVRLLHGTHIPCLFLANPGKITPGRSLPSLTEATLFKTVAFMPRLQPPIFTLLAIFPNLLKSSAGILNPSVLGADLTWGVLFSSGQLQYALHLPLSPVSLHQVSSKQLVFEMICNLLDPAYTVVKPAFFVMLSLQDLSLQCSPLDHNRNASVIECRTSRKI